MFQNGENVLGKSQHILIEKCSLLYGIFFAWRLDWPIELLKDLVSKPYLNHLNAKSRLKPRVLMDLNDLRAQLWKHQIVRLTFEIVHEI